jgi:hypothetical protein
MHCGGILIEYIHCTEVRSLLIMLVPNYGTRGYATLNNCGLNTGVLD